MMWMPSPLERRNCQLRECTFTMVAAVVFVFVDALTVVNDNELSIPPNSNSSKLKTTDSREREGFVRLKGLEGLDVETSFDYNFDNNRRNNHSESKNEEKNQNIAVKGPSVLVSAFKDNDKMSNEILDIPNLAVLTNVINQSDVSVDDAAVLDENVKDMGQSQDNLTMAWWVQLSWTAVFALMILIAIGGNCIVIWIVVAHKRMRTITNYFLVNLSTADLLLSTLNCFFNFIYMLQGNWQFGGWYCTVNNFIANTTVAASVFTLTAMSCDRHLAIVHPLHPRMSKVTAMLVIIMIWILSMILASPCLLYSTIITYRYRNHERTACILIWPDGQPTDSKMDFGYQVLFLVITYVVPMILMTLCYTSMGKVLWGSKSIGERTQVQLDSIRSKRKVVKMIIFIVFFFGLCWLPYHAYFIYTHFDRSILYTKYVQHVYLAFYWFAMANAMVNPLIYYWMNAKFRGYFRRAICCCRSNFRDHDMEENFQGRTFKSTRGDDEDATRISLRHLRHCSTSTTLGGGRRSTIR